MKHEKEQHNQYDKALDACCSPLTRETISDLELALTNSALGYEYAKLALESVDDYCLSAEKLSNEIEQHKKTYFEARDKLLSIDIDRLAVFENNLKEQKMLMFAPQSFLH